jgi:hypothetical protein
MAMRNLQRYPPRAIANGASKKVVVDWPAPEQLAIQMVRYRKSESV